jgi:antitoxin component HigA of HigAB toxin-antitoxin module
MLDKIRTQEQYEAIMQMIEKYITKATKLGGFHALNKKENQELSKLSLLANDYEKMKMLPVAFKRSLNFIIQQRLEEMNINQVQLAELINTTGSKISKILSGKQEPDIHFLKAIHKHLGIDGNLLLEVV